MPDRNRWDAINFPLREGVAIPIVPSIHTDFVWWDWPNPTAVTNRGKTLSDRLFVRSFTKTLCLRLLTSRLIPPVDPIYTFFARERAIERGEIAPSTKHRYARDFLGIDSIAWRRRKNIAYGKYSMKDVYTLRRRREAARNYEKRGEPRNDDWTTEEWREMTVEWCICRNGETRTF